MMYTAWVTPWAAQRVALRSPAVPSTQIDRRDASASWSTRRQCPFRKAEWQTVLGIYAYVLRPSPGCMRSEVAPTSEAIPARRKGSQRRLMVRRAQVLAAKALTAGRASRRNQSNFACTRSQGEAQICADTAEMYTTAQLPPHGCRGYCALSSGALQAWPHFRPVRGRGWG